MSFREVKAIKCIKCRHYTEDFEVTRMFICGKKFEIHESPFCPMCKSSRVIELLEKEKPKGDR